MIRRVLNRFAAGFAAACLVGGGLAVLAVSPAYAQDSSATTTTPASPSIVLGSSNTDSAVVSGDASFGSPTGSVAFYECGPTQSAAPCISQNNQVGSQVGLTAAANNISIASSASFIPDATGYWCFAGVYSGDSNYGGSSDTSTDECFDVTSASSSTTTTPASSSIVLGNSNSDSVVVTGTSGGLAPTGTVAFYECGPTVAAAQCTSQNDQVGTTENLNTGDSDTSSASSSSFTPTATGYWCFAGVYSGDSNYSGSSDTITDECFDVTAAASTTTTTPAESTIVHGTTDSDTDLATVTGNTVGGAPRGTVTFFYCFDKYAAAPCETTTNKVGTGVTLSPGASDSSTATSAGLKIMGVGYYCFGAYYTPVAVSPNPYADYGSSNDTAVTECFDVVPPEPTIKSFSPTSGPVGTKVTINGSNLAKATSVTFGKGLTPAKITSDTFSAIKVTVPSGAKTWFIEVTTGGGTVKSSAKFKVTQT